VYKAELYIERCISTCCNQDIDSTDYEIIVINDGSPDRSLEIIENLAKVHNNIIVISQVNKGQSAARNAGLKIASGEYIWFIDSDDWIQENCISELYEKCNLHKLDVLSFDAKDCDVKLSEQNKYLQEFGDIPIKGKILLRSYQVCLLVWNNIFRREFLLEKGLFFIEGIVHEDNEYIPRLFYYVERFMTLNKVLYNVFSNMESTTRSVNPKRSFDLLKVAKFQTEFIEKYVSEKKMKIVFSNYIGLAINTALFNYKIMSDLDKQLFYNELYKNRYLFYYMKKSNRLKYRFEALLYLFSPILFRKFYSIFS